MSTQLKKGVLEMVVLSKIAQKDSYGYDIYQEVNHYMSISESTIYPISINFLQVKLPQRTMLVLAMIE